MPKATEYKHLYKQNLNMHRMQMTKHPEAQELKCMMHNSTSEDKLLAKYDKTSKVTEKKLFSSAALLKKRS